MIAKVMYSLLCVLLVGVVAFTTHYTRYTYPDALDTHLQAISKEVHPSGSAGIVKLRAYIAAHIPPSLQVELQEFTVEGVKMVNILAYKDNDKPDTKMVSVHYDSAAHSYGAGDIGTGVAAALTLLPQWADMELDHNLLAAFVDGEEGLIFADGVRVDHWEDTAGAAEVKGDYLYGSRHFVDTYDGRYGDITTISNWEGRSTGGKLLLFETVGYSPEEVVAWNRQLPTLAFSLSEEIFMRQPNTTDVVEYRRLPEVKIFNFAFIGEGEHYHSLSDTFENVDTVSKATTYTAMKTVATQSIAATRNNAGADVYLSVGFYTLSVSLLALQLVALFCAGYLLCQLYLGQSKWLVVPLLTLFANKMTYWLALGAILFCLVYRYRRRIPQCCATNLVLAIPVILWYSLVVSIGWLLGFGSVQFLGLLMLLMLIVVSYRCAIKSRVQ